MQPIFMIGTQRSGSNLLRLMLNQLNDISSPHPPHILQRMVPLQELYGELAFESNFKLLVDDVCRLVELNPVEWDGVTLDREDVLSRCKAHSLMAIYGAVYDICAEAHGAKTWCCKSLANVNYMDDIERYFKTPKYLYLYRDGRDVALSFQKAVVGEKHIYNIAKGWAKAQEKALSLREKIGSDRLFNISYEMLTAEPEKTARAMCDFLGVEYCDNILNFHKTSEAKRAADSSALWGNVTQPVIKNNCKKYLRESSEEDIRIFESVAGHILDQLGYERSFVTKGHEVVYSVAKIAQFNEENDRLKKEMYSDMDQADIARRDRQTGLLDDIKSRQEVAA